MQRYSWPLPTGIGRYKMVLHGTSVVSQAPPLVSRYELTEEPRTKNSTENRKRQSFFTPAASGIAVRPAGADAGEKQTGPHLRRYSAPSGNPQGVSARAPTALLPIVVSPTPPDPRHLLLSATRNVSLGKSGCTWAPAG